MSVVLASEAALDMLDKTLCPNLGNSFHGRFIERRLKKIKKKFLKTYALKPSDRGYLPDRTLNFVQS